MTLFKYLQKKYLEAFFCRGSIKIGTLYEYRNVEHYGSVIGDLEEGLLNTSITPSKGDEIDLGSNSHEAIFIRNALGRPITECSNMRLRYLTDGYTFTHKVQSSDLYIYCMSSRYDKDIMTQFGCDSCMEIINPDAFLSAITHRIRHKARFEGFRAIEYLKRETDYLNPHHVHPAIAKDIEYQYQNEFRAIWNSTKPSINPLYIDVKKAIKYCRPYVR